MVDIAFIRANPEIVKKAAKDKLITVDIDRLLMLDTKLRGLMSRIDRLREERNILSLRVTKSNPSEKETIIEKVKSIKEELSLIENQSEEIKREAQKIMLCVPSIPAPEVPFGKSELDNVEIRRWGDIPKFNFAIRDHLKLAEMHDLIDIPRGVKVAGRRNYFLKNEGMLLEMAICRFVVDFLTTRGFTPMSVPLMVKEEAMTGTGYFPIGYEQAYKITEDDLYLVGTSEVSLVSYHQNETLSFDELPKKYVGFSTCFRREAGTYGKDTRGLYRVHQFQKVEQVILCPADDDLAKALHYEILDNTEMILQALELPYRVSLACTGEIGIGQIRKHEVETWMPSRDAYCETHSCSTLGDFQARRSNIKYRHIDGATQYCYTLNNTGIASPRILIPLIELNQQEDGSIKIPKALVPYMNGKEFIKSGY